jgi:hypothetical protein
MARLVKEADPELFQKLKAGAVIIPRAKAELDQRARRKEAYQLAAKEAALRAAQRGRQCWELEILPNWASENLHHLLAEAEGRPKFRGRREAIKALHAKVHESQNEIGRLYQQASKDQCQLDSDLYAAVEAEHGPIVGFSWMCFTVDANTHKRLKTLQEQGDTEGLLQLKLALNGRCIRCGAMLRPEERPGSVCTWCQKLH